MFKLVKILNSGVNVAEPRYLKTDEDTDYYAGSVVKISAGIATSVNSTDIPTHLVCEDVAHGTKSRILCHEITPDMIFEAPFSALPLGLKAGNKVTLSITSGAALGITANTTSGVAELYDLAGAKEVGDAGYVRFPN